jgi:hypothetical protein
MKTLWTDEQNTLQIKTVESKLLVRLNFKMMCLEFHQFVSNEGSN